jgi:hypothetical protein
LSQGYDAAFNGFVGVRTPGATTLDGQAAILAGVCVVVR